MHLRIPELQFALHLLDLFADAAELFFDLEQIVDVLALLFQHVDQTLLHHPRILKSRVGVEIRLGNVFGAERLVLQFAEPANLLQKSMEIFRQDLDDNSAAQFPIRLLV